LSRNPFDGIRQRKLPQAENSRAIAGREDAGERVGGRAAAAAERRRARRRGHSREFSAEREFPASEERRNSRGTSRERADGNSASADSRARGKPASGKLPRRKSTSGKIRARRRASPCARRKARRTRWTRAGWKLLPVGIILRSWDGHPGPGADVAAAGERG